MGTAVTRGIKILDSKFLIGLNLLRQCVEVYESAVENLSILQ